MNCIAALFAMFFLALPVSAAAQTPEGNLRFNLFELEGVSLSDILTFDAGMAARNDLDLPAFFRIHVPRDRRIQREVFANPDGGALVGIMFTLADQTSDESAFLEHLQITTARVPMQDNHAEAAPSRQQVAGLMARDIVFPRMVEGKQAPEILSVTALPLGNITASQVIGQHIEPGIGPMLVRVVVLPHPDQEESLMMIAKINLGLVPVRDRETLEKSLTGRIISSWQYQ